MQATRATHWRHSSRKAFIQKNAYHGKAKGIYVYDRGAEYSKSFAGRRDHFIWAMNTQHGRAIATVALDLKITRSAA